MKIKEVIIVEGKDDITAVKAALDCEVIATGGSHINADLLKSIANIHERVGIIVLTDPDYSGKKIRRAIQKIAPDANMHLLKETMPQKMEILVLRMQVLRI